MVFALALQKVQVNLDEALIRQLDAYANSLHINRTAAVSVLLTQALQADKLSDTLAEMMSVYKAEKLSGSK